MPGPRKKAKRRSSRITVRKKSPRAPVRNRAKRSSRARSANAPARKSASRKRRSAARSGRPRQSRSPAATRGNGSSPEAGGLVAIPRRRPRATPLTPKRARTLLHLEDALSERIVGKREAIEKIARVIRIRLTQLGFRPERPDGSFLLVGPTGVGKNEFAYALSEVLFGTEERVISLDLGEFDDEDDMAKLGVSPVPGSENTVMEGMLTSPVREDPEAILLLRGLERAHVSFQRILLHILERGTIEDMLGAVDFCRTIILVTTHISREEAAPAEIGFARPTKSPEELKREQLESFILPDLLDAFNEILDLPPLTPHEVRQIARYKVGKVLMRMLRRRREIEVADSVYEELITDDLCGTVGAKFLNRTLEERLFNPLARYMLSHARNQTIRIDVNQGQIVITDPRA